MTQYHLVVCDLFYSIQGEGPTSGTPAIFIRTAGCNLTCAGFSAIAPTGHHTGCDTRHQWHSGQRMTNKQIVQVLEQNGWLKALRHNAHLVITGGEPMLQQSAIRHLIQSIDETLGIAPYTEVETNGTQLIQPDLYARINQFNVSPKLSFSNEPESRRKNPEVIRQLVAHPGSRFKFVIHAPSDLEEMMKEYIKPFHIQASRVYLMPEGTDPVRLKETALWLVELCKTYHFNFTHRLHILLWGNRPGV